MLLPCGAGTVSNVREQNSELLWHSAYQDTARTSVTVTQNKPTLDTKRWAHHSAVLEHMRDALARERAAHAAVALDQ